MQDNSFPYATVPAYRLEAAYVCLERVQAIMYETGILNHKIEGDLSSIFHYLQCNIDYNQHKKES